MKTGIDDRDAPVDAFEHPDHHRDVRRRDGSAPAIKAETRKPLIVA
jgi:hypothetical protein